jgi:hypothetical protein
MGQESSGELVNIYSVCKGKMRMVKEFLIRHDQEATVPRQLRTEMLGFGFHCQVSREGNSSIKIIEF